jgi:predicted nucleic acid-binding protein
LLDANVASYIYGKRPQAQPYLQLTEGMEVVISFVTVGEMLRGALTHGWSERRIGRLEEHLSSAYSLLPFSENVAREWANLVAACRRRGLVVRDNDGWVAACATTFEVPLLSNDHAFAAIAWIYPKLVLART